MAYLNYLEYQEISIEPIEKDAFDKLNKHATLVIDIAIRHFYKGKDFEADYDWRRDAVKTAVAYQIDYYFEVGAHSYEGLNSSPGSVTLGRTSISKNVGNRISQDDNKSLLSVEAQSILSGTGLLYRGVGRG